MRIVSASSVIGLGLTGGTQVQAALRADPGIRPRVLEWGFSSLSGANLEFSIQRASSAGVDSGALDVALIDEDEEARNTSVSPSGVWITRSFSAGAERYAIGWAQPPALGTILRRFTIPSLGTQLFSFPRGIAFDSSAPLILETQGSSTSISMWVVVAL